jgi:hypothetical protein
MTRNSPLPEEKNLVGQDKMCDICISCMMIVSFGLSYAVLVFVET